MAFPVQSIVVAAVAMGGSLLYRQWVLRRMRAQTEQPAVKDALLRFFEATGYQYPSLRGKGAEAQANESAARMKDSAAGGMARYEGEWIREFDGMTVWYRFGMGGSRPLVGEWTVPLSRPPRLSWRLGSVVKGELPDAHAAWRRPRDPELAKRFRFATTADEGAVQELLQEPGLKGAILSCAYVDLKVGADAAVFRDAGNVNTYAAMGGYMGSLMAAGDPVKSLGVQGPVHDNVADVLTRATRASG